MKSNRSEAKFDMIKSEPNQSRKLMRSTRAVEGGGTYVTIIEELFSILLVLNCLKYEHYHGKRRLI